MDSILSACCACVQNTHRVLARAKWQDSVALFAWNLLSSEIHNSRMSTQMPKLEMRLVIYGRRKEKEKDAAEGQALA